METYNVILHKGVDYQSFWDDMVSDILVLPQRTTNPLNPPAGAMIVSSSNGQLRPYFWDGGMWVGMI